ncbi:uridine diphosphate glucose pyrophosphatase NUDT22 [Ornithorhynchus anatinus]|uniref:Nudix hydrolase 22 n=1 Tax=Ornithorhynchus anatinus TaxID=9258 RepID=A0A6I8NZB6_ORNAN|nr:uridine diphosphate glucose pyrophosphatase NUDT22 [Ornithorhynchus anatinus]
MRAGEGRVWLRCPACGLPEARVRARLDAASDRRRLPGGDAPIARAWASRRRAQPWLFDAPKFRLQRAELAGAGAGGRGLLLALRLGLTSYRDFLGTNLGVGAAALRREGAARWGDPQAYMADPLGVGALLATADGRLVLLRRSRTVAEAPGMLDVPGGHPEPQAVCPGDHPRHEELPGELVVKELFSSILREIRDEVNLPLATLSPPLLLGIVRNETSAGRASAEFYVRCSLTSEQVRQLYQIGGPEAHESSEIIFLEVKDLPHLEDTPEVWGELCPSAKGAVLLYNLVRGSETEPAEQPVNK